MRRRKNKLLRSSVSARFCAMAFFRSAIPSLLVLAACLQLSVCLLKEIKGLRDDGSDVRLEKHVPVEDIWKKLPLVSGSASTVLSSSVYVSRECCWRTVGGKKGEQPSLLFVNTYTEMTISRFVSVYIQQCSREHIKVAPPPPPHHADQ